MGAIVPKFSQMLIDQGALSTLPQLMVAGNQEVRETTVRLAINVNESLSSAKYLLKIGCLIPVLKGIRNGNNEYSNLCYCLLEPLLSNLIDLNSFCREGTDNYRELENTL